MKNLQTKKLKNLVKLGDIYQIGDNILGCGDAKDEKFVDKVIGDRKIHAVISDPPYGIDVVKSKEGFAKLKLPKEILNDEVVSEFEYNKFTVAWLMPIIPHLNWKNAFYIFNADPMIFALREGMKQSNVKFSQLLIWVKNHSVIGRKDFNPQHELIAYGWYGRHDFKKSKDKSLLFCPKPNKSPLHPTQKPVDLLRRLILNSTNIGDTVYDCFAGSGSLGVSAEQTKRKSILIERDEEYCQTIINRMEKLFNIQAKLISHEKE
jgi:site-specific DNA-methyltransferase (adenine-specific)